MYKNSKTIDPTQSPALKRLLTNPSVEAVAVCHFVSLACALSLNICRNLQFIHCKKKVKGALSGVTRF